MRSFRSCSCWSSAISPRRRCRAGAFPFDADESVENAHHGTGRVTVVGPRSLATSVRCSRSTTMVSRPSLKRRPSKITDRSLIQLTASLRGARGDVDRRAPVSGSALFASPCARDEHEADDRQRTFWRSACHYEAFRRRTQPLCSPKYREFAGNRASGRDAAGSGPIAQLHSLHFRPEVFELSVVTISALGK